MWWCSNIQTLQRSTRGQGDWQTPDGHLALRQRDRVCGGYFTLLQVERTMQFLMKYVDFPCNNSMYREHMNRKLVSNKNKNEDSLKTNNSRPRGSRLPPRHHVKECNHGTGGKREKLWEWEHLLDEIWGDKCPRFDTSMNLCMFYYQGVWMRHEEGGGERVIERETRSSSQYAV